MALSGVDGAPHTFGAPRAFARTMARTLLQFPALGPAPKPTKRTERGRAVERPREAVPSFSESPGVSRVANASQSESFGVKQAAEAQSDVSSVTFGEIFENLSEPLWPVGEAIILRAVIGLERLRSSSTRNGDAQTLGLTRTSLSVSGSVVFEGEYPGDDTAVRLLATWLYRFSTGRFPQPSERQVPSQINPSLPKWVDRVCVRGLTRDPTVGYQSLGQLRNELEEHRPWAATAEINALVRRVLSRLYPSEEVLATELAGALHIFTVPPPARSTSAAWKLITVVVVAAVSSIVWRYVTQT